jgi:hypothetical protein
MDLSLIYFNMPCTFSGSLKYVKGISMWFEFALFIALSSAFR